MPMTSLTKAEEQVMQILWKEKKGFVKDLLEHFPEPKPAYNTVSTIIRILEKKGFVAHRSYGKSHEYYPLISLERYRSDRFSSLMKNYFNNSMKQVLSHFGKTDSIDIKEADEIIRMMEELKEKAGYNE
ncbi:MAG TPA: BlaI/MecI/CopY family transcriptional regulator [Bacteroides sp.]|nr:BlaI/MecI/CopY family transcriptional regulator [Bacteroides sp.]